MKIASLPRYTEVATENGFIPICNYKGQRLLSIDYSLNGSFHVASDYCRGRTYNGFLNKFSGYGYSIECTAEQDVCSIIRAKGDIFIKNLSAKEVDEKERVYVTPLALLSNANLGVNIKSEELLLSAILCGRNLSFDVKKMAIIDCSPTEIEAISRLRIVGLEYKLENTHRNIRVIISVDSIPSACFCNLGYDMLSTFSAEQMRELITYLSLRVYENRYNRRQTVFVTYNKNDYDIIQIISVMCGWKPIMARKYEQKYLFPPSADGEEPMILFSSNSKRDDRRIDVPVKHRCIREYHGELFGIESPCGMILIRQNGRLAIIPT